MKNRIEWRGWVNPYVKDENKEYASEEEAEKIFAISNYKDGYDESLDDEDEKDYRLAIPGVTGAIPISVYHDFNTMQLWRADTNFIIDETVEEILNTTLGVERLTIFSPYTFVIAVGRLFESASVKTEIQKRLRAMPTPKGEINPAELTMDKSTKQKVDLLKSQLNSKYWAILVLPNCEMEPVMTECEDEYNAYMKTFLEVQEVTGAIIITS